LQPTNFSWPAEDGVAVRLERPLAASKQNGKQGEEQKRPDCENTSPKAILAEQTEEYEDWEHRQRIARDAAEVINTGE
jgi:hypothetical protein